MATIRYPKIEKAVKGLAARNLAAVDRAYKRAANEARAELRAVVEDWESDVDFAVFPTRRKDAYVYEIKAIGDGALIFTYVDEGTKAHIITPKKPGGVLAFKSGYSARTAPVAQSAVGTGKSSGKMQFRTVVHHPGNAPRQFTKTIFARMRAKLSQYVKEELSKS